MNLPREAPMLRALCLLALGCLPNLARADWLIEVGGLTCAGCEASVVQALQAVPNVRGVQASFATASACVVAAEVDEPTLIAALSGAGFTATSVRTIEACPSTATRRPSAWQEAVGLDVHTISTGARVKLADHLPADRFTIIDFSAPWCGPCHVLAKELTAWLRTHEGVSVRVIDLDAPTASASFDLPVARQLLAFAPGLPHLLVFAPGGKRLYEGGVLDEALAAIEAARRP